MTIFRRNRFEQAHVIIEGRKQRKQKAILRPGLASFPRSDTLFVVTLARKKSNNIIAIIHGKFFPKFHRAQEHTGPQTR